MKTKNAIIILILSINLFSCSNKTDDTVQTFLEKYDGTVWRDFETDLETSNGEDVYRLKIIENSNLYMLLYVVNSYDQNCESIASTGTNTILINNGEDFEFQHTNKLNVEYSVIYKYKISGDNLNETIIMEHETKIINYKLSDEPNPCK